MQLDYPLQTKRFQRQNEDFICERCGENIKGDGYTDHCPNCLWSKHVDMYPGDRKATCQGMMRPVGIEITKGTKRIAYRCQDCSHTFLVKATLQDNLSLIEELSQYPWSF